MRLPRRRRSEPTSNLPPATFRRGRLRPIGFALFLLTWSAGSAAREARIHQLKLSGLPPAETALLHELLELDPNTVMPADGATFHQQLKRLWRLRLAVDAARIRRDAVGDFALGLWLRPEPAPRRAMPTPRVIAKGGPPVQGLIACFTRPGVGRDLPEEMRLIPHWLAAVPRAEAIWRRQGALEATITQLDAIGLLGDAPLLQVHVTPGPTFFLGRGEITGDWEAKDVVFLEGLQEGDRFDEALLKKLPGYRASPTESVLRRFERQVGDQLRRQYAEEGFADGPVTVKISRRKSAGRGLVDVTIHVVKGRKGRPRTPELRPPPPPSPAKPPEKEKPPVDVRRNPIDELIAARDWPAAVQQLRPSRLPADRYLLALCLDQWGKKEEALVECAEARAAAGDVPTLAEDHGLLEALRRLRPLGDELPRHLLGLIHRTLLLGLSSTEAAGLFAVEGAVTWSLEEFSQHPTTPEAIAEVRVTKLLAHLALLSGERVPLQAVRTQVPSLLQKGHPWVLACVETQLLAERRKRQAAGTARVALSELMPLYRQLTQGEPDEIRFQIIVIPESAGIGTAEAALSRVRHGQPFGEVVERFSAGPQRRNRGVVGWTKLTLLRPRLQRELARLKPGSRSDLIRTKGEFWILKLLGRRRSAQADLGRALRQALAQRLAEQARLQAEGLLERTGPWPEYRFALETDLSIAVRAAAHVREALADLKAEKQAVAQILDRMEQAARAHPASARLAATFAWAAEKAGDRERVEALLKTSSHQSVLRVLLRAIARAERLPEEKSLVRRLLFACDRSAETAVGLAALELMDDPVDRLSRRAGMYRVYLRLAEERRPAARAQFLDAMRARHARESLSHLAAAHYWMGREEWKEARVCLETAARLAPRSPAVALARWRWQLGFEARKKWTPFRQAVERPASRPPTH